MKQCPVCWEKIQNNAKKCRFCGEWLNQEIDINESESIENKEEKDKILKESEKDIKTAFAFSLLAIWIATVTYIIDIVNDTNTYGISILDIIILAILAWCIYKKSRVASIWILIYFVMWKIVQLMSWVSIWSVVIRWMIFGIPYWKWIEWTFKYHKIMGTQKLAAWEIILGIWLWIIIILSIIWMLA